MNNATNIIDDLRLLEPWTASLPLLLSIAALLAIAIIVFLLRRHHAARPSPEIQTASHAHEDALAELEKARALMRPETSRAFGIAVSGIIRRYLERRFDIVAPRRSTEEFLSEAATSPQLNETQRALLAEFLGSCDFLKFADARADLSELAAQHQAAVHFVTETRA